VPSLGRALSSRIGMEGEGGGARGGGRGSKGSMVPLTLYLPFLGDGGRDSSRMNELYLHQNSCAPIRSLAG
jgi:hypothetical protein